VRTGHDRCFGQGDRSDFIHRCHRCHRCSQMKKNIGDICGSRSALRSRRRLAGTINKAPEPASTPQATAPFDGYPCPTCRTGRVGCDHASGPAAAWSGGDECACHRLNTRDHPSRWTDHARPTFAIAPTLEDGLQSIQNCPCVSPAAPSDARFATLRASPHAAIPHGTGRRLWTRGYNPHL